MVGHTDQLDITFLMPEMSKTRLSLLKHMVEVIGVRFVPQEGSLRPGGKAFKALMFARLPYGHIKCFVMGNRFLLLSCLMCGHLTDSLWLFVGTKVLMKLAEPFSPYGVGTWFSMFYCLAGLHSPLI